VIEIGGRGAAHGGEWAEPHNRASGPFGQCTVVWRGGPVEVRGVEVTHLASTSTTPGHTVTCRPIAGSWMTPPQPGQMRISRCCARDTSANVRRSNSAMTRRLRQTTSTYGIPRRVTYGLLTRPYGRPVPDLELLTTSELARALGLSLRSVQRYVAARQITPELTTPGGHHRWDVDNVRKQLRELAEQRQRDQSGD
jgi:hypothetical protein